jgi:hypothetical protein
MSIETLPSRNGDTTMTVNGRTFTYGDMVRALFKAMPKQSDEIMHAAIGIAGERRELYAATHRSNFIEEAGDLEFYIQALCQTHQPIGDAVQALLEDGMLEALLSEDLTLSNVFEIMDDSATAILDHSKKIWAYTKPVSEEPVQGMANAVVELYTCLGFLYRMLGIKEGHGAIMLQNAEKLVGKGGRFESFTYSDADAQARADKAGD